MPNIALTTYCNLSCPYCFANKMIQEEKSKNISIQELLKILDWLDKKENSELHRIGLIGGEPTLHPKFLDIVKIITQYCDNKKLSAILFTNGINLYQYLDYEEINKIKILININDPKNMSYEQNKNLLTSLNQLYMHNKLNNSKIFLGCNICNEINDYTFFWDFVKQYNLKQIRVSIVCPSTAIEKDMYYMQLKDKFLKFVIQAKKLNVMLYLDCNQIPFCYFTKEEQKLITQQSIDYFYYNFKNGNICVPTIDITPDFKASSCFGNYELIDCNYFHSYNELYRYLLNKKVIPKYINNNTGKCQHCIEHELFRCQGGCLKFTTFQQEI